MVLTVILVAVRKRFAPGKPTWNIMHNALAVIVVVASVVHTLMIEGAVGYLSKLILCLAILAVTAIAIVHLRVVRPLYGKRRSR